MKTVIITRSFSGDVGSFAASEEPIEVSDEAANMAIKAGFAVEVKSAKAKPKSKDKTKK